MRGERQKILCLYSLDCDIIIPSNTLNLPLIHPQFAVENFSRRQKNVHFCSRDEHFLGVKLSLIHLFDCCVFRRCPLLYFAGIGRGYWFYKFGCISLFGTVPAGFQPANRRSGRRCF